MGRCGQVKNDLPGATRHSRAGVPAQGPRSALLKECLQIAERFLLAMANDESVDAMLDRVQQRSISLWSPSACGYEVLRYDTPLSFVGLSELGEVTDGLERPRRFYSDTGL